MKTKELKELMIKSLDSEADTSNLAARLEEEGVSYNFSKNFSDRVISSLFATGMNINSNGEVEFVKGMNYIFYRIAFTGIAAILVLLLSIFLSEGSLSLNSFLGLGNGYDESIFYVLAGN